MTVTLLVVAGVVVLALAGFLVRRSLAGVPGDPTGPAPGWHRCRACRGSGATTDPTTKSGYTLCDPCNGTGWSGD